MPFRVLDSIQQGQCDPDYFDGTGQRFMTNGYTTTGIQSWGNTPGFKPGHKPSTSQSFYRFQVNSVYPRGKVNYFPTYDVSLYHKMTGLFDQYATYEPGWGALPGDFVLEAGEAEDAAMSKALQKAKDQSVNFAQNIGEFKSTVGTPGSVGQSLKGLSQYVGRRIQDVLDLYIAAKSGNVERVLRKAGVARNAFDKARRKAEKKGLLKTTSEAWLAWQYGVSPILQDVAEAAKELGYLHSPKDFVHRVVGTYSSHTSWTTQDPKGLGGAWLVDFENELNVRGKVSLEYVIADQENHDLSKWGIYNYAHTAWELVTLSFVADWFFDLGTFLSNLDATRGLTFLKGTSSSLVRNTIRSVANGRTSGGWIYDGKGVSFYEKHRMSRTPLTGFPPLPPSPRWKNPFSLHHLVTACALVSQRRL